MGKSKGFIRKWERDMDGNEKEERIEKERINFKIKEQISYQMPNIDRQVLKIL